MGLYSALTDTELAAEIAAFRATRREVVLSGVGAVKRVTDGDRTIEYTGANVAGLDRELQALLDEQARRKFGGNTGRAIGVEFY